MRTSNSDPLQIATVFAPGIPGAIGLTQCPGKKDRIGGWNRDLSHDLARIREWGAAAILTLVQERELHRLGVAELGTEVARYKMIWRHLPIRDGDVPDEKFEASWSEVGVELRALLRGGRRVLVHCRGGLGRAGMISARLLVELGMDPEAAIIAIRAVLGPAAIETREQEIHIRSCCPMAD
jgi:protein-tyrosine phosphatase